MARTLAQLEGDVIRAETDLINARIAFANAIAEQAFIDGLPDHDPLTDETIDEIEAERKAERAPWSQSSYEPPFD